MNSGKLDQTIMPPSHTNDEAEVKQLCAWFEHNSDLPKLQGLDSEPKLLGLDGESVPIPAWLFSLIQDIMTALAEGLPVSVNTKTLTVTTSQAADVLGVSRATMVRFLDERRLPYTQPGKHRRIQLADVLKFKKSITHGRHAIAADMQAATSAWIEEDSKE
jgi:excisionase family DNA binding protein